MKIAIGSDLHLNFGDNIDLQSQEDAEILLLAGDIIETRGLKPNRQFRDRYLKFFKTVCGKYKYVIYVQGNHEYYNSCIKDSTDRIKEYLSIFNNLKLLNRDTVFNYKGITFIGDTLWTNLNNNCPITALHLRDRINDYTYITDDNYSRFTPDKSYRQHIATVNKFKQYLNSNGNYIIITHHAPSFKSCHSSYKKDYYMNGGYYSNLEDLIIENTDKIKLWVHGHTHIPCEYQIEKTNIMCNPRGYEDIENQSIDYKFKVVEI